MTPARVKFTWDLWYSCNYRCSYCWWEMDDRWAEMARQHRILPPEDWLAVWDRIHAAYGEARIAVLGGEPLRYPRFGEILRGLARRHVIDLTTNLSPEPARLREFFDGIDPKRVQLGASFHPQFTELEPFREKALLLRRMGFPLNVIMVTWPPFLPRFAEYRKAFEESGLEFQPFVFQGRWEGRDYPEAFSESEKKLISSELDSSESSEAEKEYRFLRKSTKGKLCHSGSAYAIVKGSGDVYRCAQDAPAAAPMGNIFDAGFRLHEAPQPCPYGECRCNEFEYLDEVRSSKAKRLQGQRA